MMDKSIKQTWFLKNNPSNPPDGCVAVGDGRIVDSKIIYNLKITRDFKKKFNGKNIVIGIIENKELM